MTETLYVVVKLQVEKKDKELTTEDLIELVGTDMDYSFTYDNQEAKIVDTEVMEVTSSCPN